MVLAAACFAEAELAPAVAAFLDAAACDRVCNVNAALLASLDGLRCKLLGWCSTLLHATPLLLLMLLCVPLHSSW